MIHCVCERCGEQRPLSLYRSRKPLQAEWIAGQYAPIVTYATALCPACAERYGLQPWFASKPSLRKTA